MAGCVFPKIALAIVIFSGIATVRSQQSDWMAGSSGLWELSTNWNNGVPEGAGSTAVFWQGEDAYVQVAGDHALDELVFRTFQGELLLAGENVTVAAQLVLNEGDEVEVRSNVTFESSTYIGIRNVGADSLLALDTVRATDSILMSVSAPGAAVSVKLADAQHINIDGGGPGSSLSLGLGANIENIFIQPAVERVRITDIEQGYQGNITSYGSAIVDVATDYSVIAGPTGIQTESLQVSGGGKVLSRFDRANFNNLQNLVMAGGEFVQGAGQPLDLESLQIAANGASKFTFDDPSPVPMHIQNLQVADRTGALLIRGATLGSGGQQIFIDAAPTLIGSGSSGTPTVGILGQVVVDTKIDGSGNGFATYDPVNGLRALSPNEYSGTFLANANVRLTANTGIGSSITINSLILNGGRTLSGAPVTIASGMVLSSGGINTIYSSLSGAGDLSFFTSTDLVLRGTPHPQSALVKFGAADLHYEASGEFSSAVINEGTFRVVTGIGGHGDVVVNTGGRLFTHGYQMIAADSDVTIQEGGFWELDNGSFQTVDRGLAGGGTVIGSGALPNTLRIYAGFEPEQKLDVRFTGNLSLEIAAPNVTLNNVLNDYTGRTVIQNSAILSVGTDNALSANSVVEFGGSGILRLQGRSTAVAGLSGFPGGFIEGGEAGAVSRLEIRVGAGEEYVFQGSLTDNIAIEKTGEGKQTLISSFDQPLTLDVQEGTLEIGGGFEPSANPITVRSMGTLIVQGLSSSSAPTVLMETGATLTRLNAGTFPPGDALVATFLEGRNTTASILSVTSPISFDSGFRPFEAGETVSDVFSLDGMIGQVFVLQMSFDPSEWEGDPALLCLGWWDGAEWVDAFEGNSIVQSQFLGFQSWESDPTYVLGDWGINLSENAVWMVLDHNSEFAVIAVPEPSTMVLAGCGLLVVVAGRRFRRRISVSQ